MISVFSWDSSSFVTMEHSGRRGFDERGGEGLTGPAAFPVVGDPGGVRAQVAVELTHRLEQLGLGDAGLLNMGVDRHVLDDLQGTKDLGVAGSLDP
ncbi:MAG: hypothetical protein ACRDRW_16005 [Pseudonocardiaceae bacterium]